jgi:DNA ligase (NAD+)
MEKRIQELVEIINRASNAYYNEDIEIMSNFEYDALYDELVSLEKSTGIILPNSPTQFAGYDVVSKLKKVEHKHPALSLDKTKEREKLITWLKGKDGLLSWKMDGLTVVATYDNGKLVRTVTRGNGYIGEDVTHNSYHFKGLPSKIKFKGELIVRGEAIMSYNEFERINKSLPETLSKYKNPRNLASATVRMLDANESAEREIIFSAFDLVNANDENIDIDSKCEQFKWLQNLNFNVVEHIKVNENNILNVISDFESKLEQNAFPSDGLVLTFDSENYGLSLGMTGKFPRHSIAFKWKDEEVTSTIKEIIWSPSRTGLLNPVAIFEPVEIEGTTVERASIHNVSIARSLKLSVGSEVSVFKANMIIPQIARTIKSTGETFIPNKCPCCGGDTIIKENDDIETLYCTNTNCPAKQIGKFTHFVSRDCANIVGLSEATLQTFINEGFIKEFADIYHIDKYKDKIIEMEGFGEKSYNNLINAINESRNIKFSAFLGSIGISGIGKDMAKQISLHLGENALSKFVEMLRLGKSFTDIDGIGSVINENIYLWKSNRQNGEEFANIVDELNISDDNITKNSTSSISGKIFVITGSVEKFKNRDELKENIENLGGKVSGSVSSKTDYLINNDVTSNSGKNKKAKELGIPIISEQDYLNLTEQQ